MHQRVRTVTKPLYRESFYYVSARAYSYWASIQGEPLLCISTYVQLLGLYTVEVFFCINAVSVSSSRITSFAADTAVFGTSYIFEQFMPYIQVCMHTVCALQNNAISI